MGKEKKEKDRSRSRRRSRSKSRGKDKEKGKDKDKKKDRSRSRGKKEKERKRSPSKSKAKARSPSERKAKPQKAQRPDKPRSLSRDAPRRSPSRRSKASSKSSRSSSREDEPFTLVTVSLAERPYGMAPEKGQHASGYVVEKIAEDKPAAKAGVAVGWRVVSVGDKQCKEQDWDGIQNILKKCELPVKVVFEKPKVVEKKEEEGGKDASGGEEDSEKEMDLLDLRADQRREHDGHIGTLDEMPIKREPENLPPPIASWEDACKKSLLNQALVEKLQGAGLKRPTPIQRHAVPIIGHNNGEYDMIALAQTGSGKTFAFVIPTVARMVVHGATPRPFFPGKSPGCPLMLVLSPTRELAQQTFKEIEVLTKGTPLVQQVVYGGESLKFQQQRIEKSQIDIMCATPGRLIDLIDTGKISLSFIQSVVLDEADQMLEQSLEVMCAELLTGRDMPEPHMGRQTLLFSATMPQKIRDLCPKILRNNQLANLTIGHYDNNQGGSCASIKQVLRWIPDESARVMAMVEDLKYLWMGQQGKKGRVVIFTNQRLQAGYLANALNQNGITCLHLHGKLDQSVREEVFTTFKRGNADVLVATNVASRGLDFPDISFVVQYNLPDTIDIYTHRIGRTGRVGAIGCALSYVGPRDRQVMPKLIDFLELNKQEVPNFLRDESRRGGGRPPPGRPRR